MVPGTGAIISRYLDHPVVEYDHALLVTPFGIALRSAGESDGRVR